jgi:hypothetical protein
MTFQCAQADLDQAEDNFRLKELIDWQRKKQRCLYVRTADMNRPSI